MYSVGIDLGGTNIAAGIVDLDNYKIVGKASVPTDLPRSAEEIAVSIKQATLMAAVEASVLMDDVVSVGIGTPGAVTSGGVVEFAGNLGFVDTPLGKLVSDQIEKDTFVGNDANCAALGEQVAGCGDGVANLVMVTLGTGVGGGIIINNKLLTGVNGAAGEIGHMVIQMNGEACTCGRSGCFEAYASATALIRETKDALIRDRTKSSLIWKLIDGAMENVNGKVPFDAADEGDKIAKGVVEEYIHYLGIGCANLINIFQPDVLCIGGGISKQGDTLIKPLRKVIDEEQFTKNSKKKTKICEATLGNDAGIIGAALLYRQK